MPKEPPLYLYFLALSLICLYVLSCLQFTVNQQPLKPLNVLPVAKDLPLREAVLNTVSSYGIDKRIADRIIICESQWLPTAKNKSGASGLWQIMPLHGLSNEVMFDAIKSTRWAMEKRLRDGSFEAWSCN